MNRAILMGRLGHDPSLREVGSTTKVEFSLATSERWTNKDGEKQERTDWHRVEAWGKTGDIVMRFFAKGDPILVEGTIRVEQYEKDGEKKTAVKIRAERVHFVGGKKNGDAKPKGDADEWDDEGESGEIPF